MMKKELIDTTLKIINTLEVWSSAQNGLTWRQANHASTLYNLAVSPSSSLVQKLFQLRQEYLGDEAGDKEMKLKTSTTLHEIFKYITKK